MKHNTTPDDLEQQKPYPNYYAIIPAHVRYCKTIEPGAKLLYGEITALANETGFCWASNQYFADLYGVDLRTIKRWISSLADANLIHIETSKMHLKTTRKIWISLEIKNMFAKGHFCHPRGDIFVHQAPPSPYIYNTTKKNIANPPDGGPSISSKEKKPKEEKQEVADRVFLTPSQQQAALKRCDGSKELLSKAYQVLSDWKISGDISGGSDFKSLVNWAIDAAGRALKKDQKISNKPLEDQILARKIEKKYPNRNDIRVGITYLEFINGTNAPSTYLKFGDKDFRKIATEALKKRKLNHEDL